MKNYTLTFLFSVISFCCLAQTPFTEQTLLDMNKRMMQDFPKFMSEEVSPEYTFTTEDGAVIAYQTMKDFKIKVLEWNTHDLKIKQIGNAAIVRGINKNSIQSATSGVIRNYNLQFIYTYEYKNGKWLWFSSHHIYNNRSNEDEEAAIKKLLDDVDFAFNNGDKDGVINAWKNDPKISFIGSGAGGELNLIAQDFEGLKKTITQYVVKPTGAKGIKSNHRFMFKGNIAIVEFDQENIRANGAKGYSHNINIFEKVGDSWKVIVASHHDFNKPTDENNPEEIVKQWVAEYNKDTYLFFKNNCSDDFIASNAGINGGKFFGKEFIKDGKEGKTADLETTNMRSFRSGNLAVVMGNLIWHHKQADGSDKPEKTVSTFVMQKKDGKWWYVGHHLSPLKE